MNRFLVIVMMFGFLGIAAIPAQPVEARGYVSVGVGVGCCGYYPYAPAYYGYPAYYYAPPPVYVAPAPFVYGPPPLIANQASPTFVNARGETRRRYQSDVNGMMGTACLAPDGVWRSSY
jgi:hypothetical protein